LKTCVGKREKKFAGLIKSNKIKKKKKRKKER